jgi:uncharacterized protein
MFTIDDLKEFARVNMLEISRPTRHHFRDRYSHTLRVLKWAERLQVAEGGNLEVIRIASVLHDIGWDEKINHAIISRNIAEEYLRMNQYDSKKLPKVLDAIENHNNRESQDHFAIESLIVMDADILDEVGAISIVWDAMATTYEQDASYYSAYKRIKRYTEQIKQRKNLLKTETGVRYYCERIGVIDAFLSDLEYELGIQGERIE